MPSNGSLPSVAGGDLGANRSANGKAQVTGSYRTIELFAMWKQGNEACRACLPRCKVQQQCVFDLWKPSYWCVLREALLARAWLVRCTQLTGTHAVGDGSWMESQQQVTVRRNCVVGRLQTIALA